MKKEEKKGVKEAKEILKDIEFKKAELPDKEKDILQWNTKELRAYILHETAGMNPTKKLQFAGNLIKRINGRKKENGL